MIDIRKRLWFNSSNVHAGAVAQQRSRAKTSQRIKVMPNNAGAVDATPTRKVLHLQYIDSDGKSRTDSYDVPMDVTDAELNALSAALGATTNASLWNIGYTNWFATGSASIDDADDLTNDSVKDNVVILFKNASNLSFDFFIPANLETVTMVPGTENPDMTTTEAAALIAAIEAIWSGYTAYSARFSERSQKNRAVKL
jgi:hypothetical protein